MFCVKAREATDGGVKNYQEKSYIDLDSHLTGIVRHEKPI